MVKQVCMSVCRVHGFDNGSLDYNLLRRTGSVNLHRNTVSRQCVKSRVRAVLLQVSQFSFKQIVYQSGMCGPVSSGCLSLPIWVL